MIVVRIAMNVLQEKQKELVQTILSMIGPMENEAGCLSYALFCNIEDKNLLNLLEEWQTRKDLDRHLRSEFRSSFKVRNVQRFTKNQEPFVRSISNSNSHSFPFGQNGER
jgi:quinol monooxygenase YgiN